MRFIAVPFAIAIAVAGAGCSQEQEAAYPDEECRDDFGDDAKNAARVSGEAVEGGAETAWAGIKQAGRGTGGLVTGGTDDAEAEWEKGKAETRQERDELKGEVAMADKPRCPTR
jgi:hypothetical protein